MTAREKTGDEGLSRPVAIGAEVCTRDGKSLGRVAETRGGFFKVDAPRALDYWLSCTYVRPGAGDARVEVDFDASVLEDYRLDVPKGDVAPSPALAAQADVFESAGHKHAKREEMMHPGQQGQ